jgi:hypothetical protein
MESPVSLLLSIDYAAIACRFTRTRRRRCMCPQVWRRALPVTIRRMNTYATTGCCIATLPTMQEYTSPSSMLQPQHAGYAAP